MKKSTLEAIRNYLTGMDVDVTTLKQEIDAEYERVTAKARQNASLYETALEVVLAHLSDTEITASALFDECKDELPAEFTQGKMNYLLRQYPDKIQSHANGRNVNTYTAI